MSSHTGFSSEQFQRFHTRRDFLVKGSVAAAGGLIAFGGGWRLAMANDAFADQVEQVLSSSDALAVRQLGANLVKDPAVTALASRILQIGGSSLTGFQVSLLQSILIM